MKSFSIILTSFTVLILLVFGTGGVGVAKCNCSGKTSLVLPLEHGCCPTESDCMSVTIVQLSDYEMQHNNDAPQPSVLTVCPVFGLTVHQFVGLFDSPNVRLSDSHHHPPANIVGTVVLRV